jgi:hypothetical protein
MPLKPPSTSWKEVVPEGEEAVHRALAITLRELQAKRDAQAAKMRALHPKRNIGLLAELEVLPDLPAHAKVALFAEPKTYKAYVRFSNGAMKPQPDRKGDVRGIGVKILGAPGKKLIPGMEDETTQDFLAIRDPAVPFANAREFVAAVRAAANPLAIFGFFGAAGFFRALGILRTLTSGLARPIASIAATHYFSALPIRFGEHAVKYAFRPHATAEGPTPEDLGAELAERVKKSAVTWDLQLQFYVDDVATPIEDPTVPWSEEASPWSTVARLTIPVQDVGSARGAQVTSAIEAMSFDPWHAAVELRPIGELMRARNHAYRESTIERGAAKEPKGADWLA